MYLSHKSFLPHQKKKKPHHLLLMYTSVPPRVHTHPPTKRKAFILFSILFHTSKPIFVKNWWKKENNFFDFIFLGLNLLCIQKQEENNLILFRCYIYWIPPGLWTVSNGYREKKMKYFNILDFVLLFLFLFLFIEYWINNLKVLIVL